ncbi:regulator of G-protein signaling 2-like [Chanos chanos]|uniref:Regulator of G-protein signaling 2-like n=1 Tax=Chanos chanos TaxID=29144 RepID=A0A6J2VCU6_CHACN|nr:regulator of G-protein signaling 2-like [Chanos chanos]
MEYAKTGSDSIQGQYRDNKRIKTSLREVDQWAQSFEKLLSQPYGRLVFQLFLKSEFCEENIEFWLACEDFRSIKNQEILALKARSIYEEFVRTDSPKEINLDYHTRETVAMNVHQPTRLCFEEAQKKIYSLMENDAYPRFIQSDFYKNLCAS